MLPPKDFPDAEFHEQVGRLCVAWAFLEVMLQHRIWELLKIDKTMGKYVTYRLDAKLRWQTLCELALEHDQEFHSDLKAKNSTM